MDIAITLRTERASGSRLPARLRLRIIVGAQATHFPLARVQYGLITSMVP